MTTWLDEVTLYTPGCDECGWHGAQTTEQDDAEAEAEQHERESDHGE